jgi:hypothetical protein
MSADSVTAPIRSEAGAELASLSISRLPGRADRLELDGDRIVLEEEGTYVFAIDGTSPEGPLHLEPGDELFSFDDGSRARGRLQPRQHVGRIRVVVRSPLWEGIVVFSVRPKKLAEETEYREMLDDIADIATEAILQGFAPAALALEHDTLRRPELLYQQFAFLHARLTSSGEDDLAMVLHRPHRTWLDEEEHRLPGTPFRGSSKSIRALTRPGPRVATPTLGIPSVPQRIAVTRSEETLDTEPNRFVLFALKRWRAIAFELLEILRAGMARSGPISRGIDAAEEIIELLDRTISAPMFREVGRLASFPTGSQVLQKRAGYRELLRTFVLTETGARLALDWDIDDVFGASQRNIATLYEYWAFLQLARSVGRVCGDDQSAQVLSLTNDGMSMTFRPGKKSRLRWMTTARGREVAVELYFNRTFLVSAQPDASWTRAMRPDCSLRVRPTGLADDVTADDLSIWLHFDAKYRLEYASEQFSQSGPDDDDVAADAEATERLARSKREDLLKMHAYRDSIRRSAGAYVLYPGFQSQAPFVEHHEVLPGLGSFVLRPAGDATVGAEHLEAFLADVLDHVADRATHHERSRYWRTVIHRIPPVRTLDRRLPALDRPPSDALVLCGYTRGAKHRRWIEESGLYNVRAGDRPGAVSPQGDVLQASDVVLYGPGVRPTLWKRAGAWFVQTQLEMQGLGYPNPRGPVYLCCPIERSEVEPEWLGRLGIGSGPLSGAVVGAPFVATWQALLDAAG